MTSLSRRPFVRLADGTDFLVALTVSGITTVLVVRAFLAITGYPQIGGDSLHIAHVLWGGLSMLGALVIALLFVGKGARMWTALLGGVGLGLFVDEVGKFVTNTNDYFYRPAAAIIYVVFAGLVLAATLIDRDKLTDRPERIVNAAMIATTGLASGLTPSARRAAMTILEGRDEPQADAVRRLLDSIPDHEYSSTYNKVLAPVIAFTRSAMERSWFVIAVLLTFTVQAIGHAVFYVSRSIDLLNGEVVEGVVERQAIYAIAVSDTVSAILAATSVVLLAKQGRRAFECLRLAVLVNLLFGQVFNFTDSQFAAVAGLPFNLLALGVAIYKLR